MPESGAVGHERGAHERDPDAAGALAQRQAEQLDRLAALIAESPHNLVSRGERSAVRERHVGECAALAPLLGAEPGQTWVDVGTGGGLPGLVLAVLQPDVRWTLIDATRKKTTAVRAFADELGLPNVQVVVGRAETLAREPAYREQFDGAVSRALASLPTLIELCRGFVRTAGVLAAVKGPRWEDEVESSAQARGALRVGEVAAAAVPGAARPTWLLTMRTLGPTPPAYPRRDGRPASHPIGGGA